MSKIKESIVQCDYCGGRVFYSKAYPCINPPGSSVQNEHYICSFCLEQEFCEYDHHEQEERYI